MKILLLIFGFLFFTTYSGSQKSPEPVTNFLKLKWEVEISTKNILPVVSGNYLFTADKFAIDSKTGQELSLPFNSEVIKDSLLAYDNESKLEIINIKTDKQIMNVIRRRTRYVGKKGVDITNDSIWIEVDYKMNISAINILNQKKIWSTQSPSRIVDKPIIHDKKVFVVNKEEILVLSRNNGEIVNRFPTDGQVLSELTLNDNYLYFIVRDVGLVAYNLDENKVEWKFNMGRYSGHINKIVIDNEVIYFADANLYAVNRNDGNLIWKLGEEKGIFIRRPDHLTKVKSYLLFYVYKHNENILTVSDKNTGEILYQGFNSSVLGGGSNNPDGVAKEDLLLIDIVDEFINDNILIGVMDDKIFGLEVMK